MTSISGTTPPRILQGVLAVLILIGLGALGNAAIPSGTREGLHEFRPLATPEGPPGNEITEARVALGKTLFFDPRLSSSGVTSCATCHNPAFDWGDGLPVGVGAGLKPLKRRSPTILNVAWAEALFWDGRAATLEEQALGPIQSAAEMDMTLEEMVKTVSGNEGYRPLFEAAYPGGPISPETVAKAIASFERTVISSEAPFDGWVGGDEAAITESAKRGFQVFTNKANCSSCHAGWRFTDDSFHDIGVAGDDIGRGSLFEGIQPLQYAFKTPTLRNVERRGPYMHNGSEATLAEVIELYDQGGRETRSSLSEEIRPLELTDGEKGDLLAFMKALTSLDPATTIPTLPR